MDTNSGEKWEAMASPMDRMLADEQDLIPSSGFLSSVMDRVHEEARMPAPMVFPWRRAIPGVVLAAGVFGWGGFEMAREAMAAMRAGTLTAPEISLPLHPAASIGPAGWVAISFGISLASWMVSRRLMGQNS
jgi:hypothetical protein